MMRSLLTAMLVQCLSSFCHLEAQQEKSSRQKVELRDRLNRTVDTAFSKAHQGYSTDEVLLDDSLRSDFLRECRLSGIKATEFEYNWTLLNLRKAGGISAKSTARKKHRDLSDRLPLAEAVARSIQDEYKISTDRIIADPVHRERFDRLIRKTTGDSAVYPYRKAVFHLRKQRRLRPELIVRVANWGTRIDRLTVAAVQQNENLVSAGPGVYLFYDRTGYLYIGEARNLRERLKKHVSESDRISLLGYLKTQKAEHVHIEVHSFSAESEGRKVTARRAYESELIRTRNPRFNVRP